jgi:ELWxxDGT repeat protein
MKWSGLLFIISLIIQYTSAIAQIPNIIKDINVNSEYIPGSHPEVFCHIGNIFFFVAYTDEVGFELWRTDGTDTGTFMLRDITSGEAGY